MDDEKVINCLTMPFHAIKATIPVTAPSDLKSQQPTAPFSPANSSLGRKKGAVGCVLFCLNIYFCLQTTEGCFIINLIRNISYLYGAEVNRTKFQNGYSAGKSHKFL